MNIPAALLPPALPFPGYKWRWATFQPSEGLIDPAVYLGVLRALADHEGDQKGDAGLLSDLAQVEADTGTRVNLVRTPDRNLLRNSGQYWEAFGLYDAADPVIRLTPLGRALAEGRVTQDEFGASVVRGLILPNVEIEPTATISAWNRVGLRIRPLELILRVMAECSRRFGRNEAFLTQEELVRIVIPLAGVYAPIGRHAVVLRAFRDGLTTLPGWPNVIPAANDGRMAREFLIFLDHYGFCASEGRGANLRSRLILSDDEVASLVAATPATVAAALTTVRADGSAEPAERRRVLAEVTVRPGQVAFRRAVVVAYAGRCLLTGESFPPALQAAHIRPVKNDGPDHVSNGLLLRADLHLLYDAGHIRIDATGALRASAALSAAAGSLYTALPAVVAWPASVSSSFVDWRERYT